MLVTFIVESVFFFLLLSESDVKHANFRNRIAEINDIIIIFIMTFSVNKNILILMVK